MEVCCTHLPYEETEYFSALVIDYLNRHDATLGLYDYYPDITGIAASIAERKKHPVNRKVLVKTLNAQYANAQIPDAVVKNIALLASENTFTICTAHQPNLLTGYLYFIYKIIHAIKLAEDLKRQFPDNNFVPVYYMGSEDNDLDELGTFRYNDKKFIWDANRQTGAVGRMDTESLKPLLDELFKLLGPPGDYCEQLKDILSKAYIGHKTISAATHYLVNELFGRYGLVILNPDETVFKRSILNIMRDDLLLHTPETMVSVSIKDLEVNYKAQAHPREINLFYLKDSIRERIEKHNDRWVILGTEISFSETELIEELNNHPERFSPNVILRGILQESILPDVAFIGGGAEVAYWLELKTLFKHYHVFYPAIILRQSVLWAAPKTAKLRKQLGLSVADTFKDEAKLIRGYLNINSKDDWHTTEETNAIETILKQLQEKADKIDPTLHKSAEAAIVKMKHQLEVLEQKMLRAEKKKMQIELLRISKLKADLFPNKNLQERVENFIGYYLQYGESYTDILKDAIQPLKNEFLVIEEET